VQSRLTTESSVAIEYSTKNVLLSLLTTKALAIDFD
jgi:hypothetical protein